MIDTLTAGLEGLPMIRTIRRSPVFYPLVNGAHILAFAVMMGALAAHHLAVLRPGRWSLAPAAAVTLPLIRWGLGFAVATGSLLFATRAGHYVENPAMLLKLGLIGLAGVNAAVFHRIGATPWKPGAILSLTLWIGALFAGRWIGVVG